MRIFRTLAIVAIAAASLPAIAEDRVYQAADPRLTESPRKNPRNFEPPDWPSAARGKSGVVALLTCVDANGRLTDEIFVESSGSRTLDNAVVEWARDVKWLPAEIDGAPVAVCGWPLTWVWGPPGASLKLPYPYLHKAKVDREPGLYSNAAAPQRPPAGPVSPPDRYVQAGVQRLDLCIGPTGAVEKVILVQGLYNPALNDAIRQWAYALPFEPAMTNGKAVGVCGLVFEYEWTPPTFPAKPQ